ncbi:MAG: hypothetical protein CLLPBCKN_000443 [Chroococcidiopsis cubana SAG 39.79]|nr:hypothetical protein [Chroococcidiopsis cubana SAG 39.79]
MRVQYGKQFCPNAISFKSSPRKRFEKLANVNYTPLSVVTQLDSFYLPVPLL